VRLFQAGPLILTLLYRFFFGDLMVKFSKDKFNNGIMIGINPLSKQWEEIARRFIAHSKNFFDGDYKWWDKKMHPVFQRTLNKVLRKFFKPRLFTKEFNVIFGTQYTDEHMIIIFGFLLELIISTPIIVGSQLFISTHNLPSGIALTAFYNSLMNRTYSAYCYYKGCLKRNRKPTVLEFLSDILDYVYGDDKLVSVKDRCKDVFNPMVIKEVMMSIGLDFTPADKSEWKENNMFKPLSEVSFLKRRFLRHPKLNSVVGPLDVVSMEGTLNYIKNGVLDIEMTTVKLENFQREAFLHYESYHKYMKHIENYLESKQLSIHPRFMSEGLLTKLYNAGEYGSDFEDLEYIH